MKDKRVKKNGVCTCSFIEDELYGKFNELSSEKLQKLGWKYRPLEETLVDAVRNYQDSGFLAEH